jgi:hypothetical protein
LLLDKPDPGRRLSALPAFGLPREFRQPDIQPLLAAICSPEAPCLTAFRSLSCFETFVVSFSRLYGSDQFCLFHFANLDVALLCYYLDFFKFHFQISNIGGRGIS